MPPATTSHATRQRSEQPVFNAASIAAMSSSVITSKGFSQSEKRAAARAILRHNLHIDNETYAHDSGLNRLYIDLHGESDANDDELKDIRAITNDTFRDVLDAVSYFYPSIRITNLPESGLSFRCYRWRDIACFALPRLPAQDHHRS